jgi:hypothetical protein
VKNLTTLDLGHAQVTDDGFAHLTELAHLERLNFPKTALTGVGLKYLPGKDVLKELEGGGKVTDQGMREIGRFHNMEALIFSGGSRVTNDGLKYLRTLPRLEKLVIEHFNVTDEGMKHVGQLRSLRHLDIYATNVTSQGVEHLYGLKNLERLAVGLTKISISEIDTERFASLKSIDWGG